jgi:methyl-accepting chemotaxis protein
VAKRFKPRRRGEKNKSPEDESSKTEIEKQETQLTENESEKTLGQRQEVAPSNDEIMGALPKDQDGHDDMEVFWMLSKGKSLKKLTNQERFELLDDIKKYIIFGITPKNEKDQNGLKENVEDQLEQEPVSVDNKPETATLSRAKQSLYLRNGFMVSLGSGAIVIGFFNTEILKAVLLSASVMLGYLFWAQRFIKHPVARELFADSFYYLGFLFTFMALIWGIIDIKGDFQQIVSQMGIALVTTIIGMTVRIFLVQFSPIVSEPDQDLMLSLGKLANEMESLSNVFIKNLGQSVSQLSNCRIQLVGELEEAKTSLTDNLQKTYEDTHKVSVERISSSLEGFQNIVQNVNAEISQFTEKLQGVDVESINEASPKLGQTMTELSSGISSVNNQLANVSSALIAAAADLETLSNSAEQIQSAQLEFEKVASKTIQLNASLEEANKAASDGQQKIEARLSVLENSFNDMEKKAESVGKAAEELKNGFEKNALDIVKFLRDETKR